MELSILHSQLSTNNLIMADDKKIIFSMVGVSKSFQSNKQVLKNIYLSFFYGAKIGIIGLNGSGKSTLLKIIAGLDKSYQGAEFRIGAQIMDFIKDWFISADNKTGCRFILVDAVNNSHTLIYYERNGFKPLFPRVCDEKAFYDISENEELRTRMYYFDLLAY